MANHYWVHFEFEGDAEELKALRERLKKTPQDSNCDLIKEFGGDLDDFQAPGAGMWYLENEEDKSEGDTIELASQLAWGNDQGLGDLIATDYPSIEAYVLGYDDYEDEDYDEDEDDDDIDIDNEDAVDYLFKGNSEDIKALRARLEGIEEKDVYHLIKEFGGNPDDFNVEIADEYRWIIDVVLAECEDPFLGIVVLMPNAEDNGLGELITSAYSSMEVRIH